MTVAPTASRVSPTCGRLAIESAKTETKMAITSDAMVIVMSYESGIGSEKASMPMKCIDQIPQPMAAPPPRTQMRAEWPLARATREDRLRAV